MSQVDDLNEEIRQLNAAIREKGAVHAVVVEKQKALIAERKKKQRERDALLDQERTSARDGD